MKDFVVKDGAKPTNAAIKRFWSGSHAWFIGVVLLAAYTNVVEWDYPEGHGDTPHDIHMLLGLKLHDSKNGLVGYAVLRRAMPVLKRGWYARYSPLSSRVYREVAKMEVELFLLEVSPHRNT